ncbi:hypothetical protein KAF25_008637 [Fusarium avenaceum]|uniref:NACHT domain-containing protein n=1 Tax=Fusarium avenaceum TaxID=40199 RepID=A0A9P7KWE2_9HYPO|nr:hypothetical protein KAF25_008637 [Fusarium avenaceum]
MSWQYQQSGYPIYLFTTPLKNQRKLFNKPVDVIGHWAAIIGSELCLSDWKTIKDFEKRGVSEPKLVGYTARPWPHNIIEKIANLIWQTSLQEKYVYDENNCQVFIRLLVDLVGDADVKAKFPTFFSEEVKKAGIARDSTFLIATAGMATVAAGTSLMFAPVDPSGASAAGFFIAASTALRSTTSLWTARINKEEFIKKAQTELRQRLISDQILLVGTRPGAALITTRAQSSDDVKELEITIACFQAILSDDERIQLQQLKKTSHDAQSIITFTAELDRLEGKRRGRSVASRLASFLQTVEQFTPIIDTYIQSNPEIAALIWGSIKLTFMFLANFTSYFQSFVELLNGFGTLCTRFANYQVVFKDSSRLRTLVCQFHTAVVTCCQKIIMAARQSLTSKLLKALTKSFQTELRGYVENIRTKAEDVQAEISLTKAQYDREEQQLQTKERQDAANYRKRLLAWTSKSNNEMEELQAQRRRNAAEQKRFRLLRDLSSYEFTSALNRTRNKRHLGTAQWVFKTPEFQEWANGNHSSVLHLTGKIGSGKTVLTSSIVEKLSQARPPNQFVSFFFLQFNDSVSLDTETITRSCVQQILSTASIGDSDPESISELDERVQEAKSSMFSREQLLELYSTASTLVKDWFIVIDGLDECSNSQQLSLLKFFKDVESLGETRCIKMLFSSREACSKVIGQIFPASTRLVTGRQETSSDIGVYVEDIIIDKVSSGELVVHDPGLIDEIANTIASKEHGMFLWAFLTIEDLCSAKNDKEIRQALQEIPTELPGTFDRALRRIVQRRNQEIAKKIFSWTKAVLRPLTLFQLREALSIEIGQHTLDHDSLINGIDRLSNWCESLIYVEETDNTIRFSHISVQEYLLKEVSGELQSLHIEAQKCDLLVGETCITYVNLHNFHTAIVERDNNVQKSPPSSLDMGQLAGRTIQSVIKGEVGTRMGRLAQRIVKPSSSSKTSANDALATFAPASAHPKNKAEYPFLEYATDHWFKHTTYLSSKRNPITWALLDKTIRKPPELSWGETWHHWTMRTEFRGRINPDAPMSRRQYLYYVRRLLEDLPSTPTCQIAGNAFLYADSAQEWGLACRAFQLFAEAHRNSQKIEGSTFQSSTQSILCKLAANKNHESCINECLTFVRQDLYHEGFVVETTNAIAFGISYIPPLANHETTRKCECAKRPFRVLQQDFCSLLATGYKREQERHLQAFAILASDLEFDAPITLKRLCETCQLEDDVLLDAMTGSGKFLLDVLVRTFMWTLFANPYPLESVVTLLGNHIALFFGLKFTDKVNSKLGSTQDQLDDSLLIINTASDLAEERLSIFFHTMGHVPLSKGIIREIFLIDLIPNASYLQDSTLDEIVGLFLLQSLEPGLDEIFYEIFRSSLMAYCWNLTAALLGDGPGLSKFGFYDLSNIRHALRCQKCQDLNRVNRSQAVPPKVDYVYNLCAVHIDTLDGVSLPAAFTVKNKSLWFILGKL